MINEIINKKYEEFVVNYYNDFSQGYELYPSNELNYQLMFDEWISEMPDSEIEDWIYRFDPNTDEDFICDIVDELRNTVSETTKELLNRNRLIGK